jgi:hypothetical protein
VGVTSGSQVTVGREPPSRPVSSTCALLSNPLDRFRFYYRHAWGRDAGHHDPIIHVERTANHETSHALRTVAAILLWLSWRRQGLTLAHAPRGTGKGRPLTRPSTVVFLLGSALTLVACGEESTNGPTIKVTGSVLISEPSHFSRTAESCTGANKLAGVRAGLTVTIDNETTATLAEGSITQAGSCRFLFVTEIPDKPDPKRYEVKLEGFPPVVEFVHTQDLMPWQTDDSDGWVAILLDQGEASVLLGFRCVV